MSPMGTSTQTTPIPLLMQKVMNKGKAAPMLLTSQATVYPFDSKKTALGTHPIDAVKVESSWKGTPDSHEYKIDASGNIWASDIHGNRLCCKPRKGPQRPDFIDAVAWTGLNSKEKPGTIAGVNKQSREPAWREKDRPAVQDGTVRKSGGRTIVCISNVRYHCTRNKTSQGPCVPGETQASYTGRDNQEVPGPKHHLHLRRAVALQA